MLNRIAQIGILLLAVACVKIQSQKHGQLIELDEENWRLMLDGEWMVEFFAPWCPACKTLSPVWDSYARQSRDIRVAKIDVTKSPALSGRFFVTALPTIFHVFNGEFRQYRGSRDLESLILFASEKKWKSIEPVSSWKNPASIQMSTLSYFFKLSHFLKDVNTRLHEDYGLPTWGSYALFAIATIFLGAILGLMLVCVVDFLYPPKNHRQSFSETKERDQNEGASIEDIPGDELEDEDDEADDDEEQIEEASTTEDEEKNSGSDSDVPESDKKQTSDKSDDGGADDAEDSKKSSPEVRKRKSRKAD